MKPERDLLERLFTTMLRIRRFEETAKELFQQGRIKGTAHSCVGQEAIAAGACAALGDDDFIVSHHRGHGHCIAKGARTDLMLAELLGRETGYCRGLGGSMHIADLELNILGANGIVAAGTGIGTGAALAAKLRKTDQVVVAFFGDGAVNEGIFHEAINLATIWKLPIVFFCENNQYGLSARVDEVTAGESIASRAKGYGIPGRTVDGNDVLKVYEATRGAIARARDGKGPTLIEGSTYRWGDHSMRANLPRYRPEEEERKWIKRDPIRRLERRLRAEGVLSAERIEAIRQSIQVELDGAVRFALDSAEPDVELMEAAVYAPHKDVAEPVNDATRSLTYVEALNEALREEMERDPGVFLMGEDIGKIGGLFGVTRGLRDMFGADRVRDTPISEAGFAAAAVGAAVTGLRPVVEVQFFDFITHMMDMIVNQAAKFRYMLGGKPTMPIVIRGPQGGGIRLGAQHSQSLEAWFAHVPGLVVVAPSTPFDAKGLLVSAIRDDNPVMFLEHKVLYLAQASPVPEQSYAIPLGKADVKRSGTDVTVVATQVMVERALAAADQLAREGISVEVIDLRTIRPLDEATILESVRKTNRLVIAHEACKRGGFGAEIVALVVEQAFDYLDAPIARVGAREVPMPYNDKLEREVIPAQRDIAAAVRSIC